MPLAKKFTKGFHSVVIHVLYHFCDMCLTTACAIFCSLRFHVVCTWTFFGDTIFFLRQMSLRSGSKSVFTNLICPELVVEFLSSDRLTIGDDVAEG